MTATSQPSATPAGDRPLTVPLLVRGSLDNFLLIASSLVALSFAGIALLAWWKEPPGNHGGSSLLLGFACLFSLPAVVLALWIVPRRRWLEVTLTGFVLTRRGRKTVVADEQVVAVRHRSKTNSQRFTRCRSRIEIDQDGAVRPIDCVYRIAPGQVDPLAAFLDRLVRGLAQRTRQGLERGAALSGKAWRIDRDGLHCRLDGKETIVPLDRLCRAGIHAGHVCIWKDEDERPFLRIAAGSRNAYPLAVLLNEVIAGNPGRATALPGKPLGRIVLDRPGTDRAGGLVLLGLFVILLAVDGLAALASIESALLVAILPALVLPLAVLHLYRTWQVNLRFHEAGLSQTAPGGQRELLYSEIGTLTWRAGAEIVCEPLPGIDRPVIRCRGRFVEDADMVALRDFMAAAIARRWAEALARQAVPWTPRLRFLPGGMEYRHTGLLGSGEPLAVPYHSTAYRIENGWFLFFVQGQTRPVVRERLSEPNIYPGLVLLNWIYASYRAPAGAPGVAAPAPRLETIGGQDERITAEGPRPGQITPQAPGPPGPIQERQQ